MGILCWMECAMTIIGTLSVLTYLVPYLLQAFYFQEQDLKKKYDAEWAVVTGASSGIGRAITEKLAAQGINVVMVALNDSVFEKAFDEVTKKYADRQFRKVGADLSSSDPAAYMTPLLAAVGAQGHGIDSEELRVSLVFNNAGFMSTSLFADAPLGRLIGNYNCNATSMIHITHHFVNRMLDTKLKGAVFFTSSPAGLNANPSVCMYGSTKAWMTSFASSLAAELRPDGIDVLVVHPSPVDTGFYAGNTAGLDAPKFFQRTAGSPVNVASCYFRSIGRLVNHDQGYYPVLFRVLLKALDVTLFNQIIAWASAGMSDYKKLKKARPFPAAGAAAK